MKDIKDLFVPYEIAVKAKEKGFNEPCLARFIDDGHNTLERWDWDIPLKNSTNEEEDTLCTAPLYSQIVDWFREEHKTRTCETYILAKGWGWGIYKENKLYMWFPDLTAAINEAFNLI